MLELLKRANKLKDTEWKEVFLAPDLTRLDREVSKRLRAERDKLNNEFRRTRNFSLWHSWEASCEDQNTTEIGTRI
jgi:hypothetical protein